MAIVKHLLVCILVVAHLAACTTSPVPIVSKAQRSHMGLVGVGPFSAAAKGELTVDTRGRGAGAAAGAAHGALEGFLAMRGWLLLGSRLWRRRPSAPNICGRRGKCWCGCWRHPCGTPRQSDTDRGEAEGGPDRC